MSVFVWKGGGGGVEGRAAATTTKVYSNKTVKKSLARRIELRYSR